MAEGMADDSNNPGDKHIAAYDSWGSGGWGGLLTGTHESQSSLKAASNIS